MTSIRMAMSILTLLMTAPAARAQTPTIDKIKERGELVIGHRPGSPPMSFFGTDNLATGYTVEICKEIARHIAVKLGMPDLRVRFVPVDAANGIPLVQNGTIDMECAGTGNTLIRQQVVAFTYNIFYGETKFLAKSAIKSVDDLRGKTVSVIQGTIQQKMLADLDKERNLGLRVVNAKDVAESFLMLETDRSDAVINLQTELSPHIAKSRNAAAYAFVEGWTGPGQPATSIDIAKGDDTFRLWANEAIKAMMASGAFEKNYQRWFLVPPFNMPMPEKLRQQIADPNDKGV